MKVNKLEYQLAKAKYEMELKQKKKPYPNQQIVPKSPIKSPNVQSVKN